MRGWWFGVWLAACTGQSAAPDDPEVSPAEADADGDGVSLIDGDCDDHDNARAPTVAERCNGVDDDCDGRVDDDPFDGAPRFVDADGDGFGDPRIQRIVCADAPGLVDDDRDCDDGDAAISPDAWEVCNGIDDDCDRAIDDADVDEADKRLARGEPIPVPLLGGATLYHPDFDGDGWPTLAGAVWACAPELGYVEPAGAAGPWDCDDDDDGLHPGAAEGVAPGQDLDCDGVVRCWADADGDGHGDARVVVTSAEPSCQAEGVAADGADCDDADPAINHERPEVCDPGSRVDEDCDGLIDDADPSAVGQIESYLDADHDGWASAGPPLASCRAVAGASPTPGGDCRDDRRDVYPGAPELCDGVDNNCDSQADEGTDAAPSCWFDADQDGWGDDGTEFGSCDCLRDRGVPRGGDCDAFVRGINPGAVDVCNGVDDDCTGVADDDPRTSLLLFGDGDGDGHGDAADPRWLCAVGPGVSELDDDCDDGDATVYAGAPPVVCDLRDNDCDPNTWEPAEVRVDGLPAGPLATAAIGAGAQVELCEGRHEAHDLILPPDVTLVGLVARDRVRVDAGGVGAALRVEGALTLRQLTVVGGAGVRVGADTWGGAVWVAPGQALTAEDVRVTGSSAGHGGGLWLGEDARATLVGVRIDTNVGDAGGAIVNEGGGVVAEVGAALDLIDVSIADNRAARCGGLVLRGDNAVTAAGSAVSGNRSTSLAGGGVCATGAVIAGLDVLDNRSDNGAGGIDGADLTLSDLVIRGNRAALSGGGVFVSGAASFTDVVLDGNQADIEGGGIYLPFDRSELTLTRCAVSANHADFFAAIAGGVWLDGGRLISVDTSWGGAGTDNRPADVGLSRSHQTFGRQGVASFVCDDATGACQ